jgi:hypothetical protein
MRLPFMIGGFPPRASCLESVSQTTLEAGVLGMCSEKLKNALKLLVHPCNETDPFEFRYEIVTFAMCNVAPNSPI